MDGPTVVDPRLLGRGLLFGFSVAASVGPMWLLCARRTLAEGRLVGLLSGLGVATADGLYGALAALGVSAVSGLLLDQRPWLRVAGGLFLLYLGLTTAWSRPTERTSTSSRRGLWGADLSTLGLTLANPGTILAFTGIFAGLGLADAAGEPGGALALVSGVFLGSAAWWLVLSAVIGAFRRRVTPGMLRAVNLLSGALIALFGLLALAGPP